MPMILSASENESGVRGFQQLIADAVDLAGSISPYLRTELISILGPTFPAEMLPTTRQQEAGVRAVLRMLEYARHEADQVSALQNARKPLNTCVAVLIDHASFSQIGFGRKYH
jgi:hypothetical protein